MATHYEILGVERDATEDEVRRAYVSLARRHHPDRGAPSTRAMQDVNAAWRVLGHVERRREYDRSLAGPERSSTPPPPLDPDDLVVRIVRSLPWIVATVVLVVIFVFTAFASSDSDGAAPGSTLIGHCVPIAGSTRPVPCEPGMEEVVVVAVRARVCPDDTTAMPYEDDWLCLRPFEGPG